MSIRKEVSIKREGKTYVGSFETDEYMLTVYYKDLRRKTFLHGAGEFPETLARIVLSDMVSREKQRSN